MTITLSQEELIKIEKLAKECKEKITYSKKESNFLVKCSRDFYNLVMI